MTNLPASSDHIHQQQGTVSGSGVDKLSSLKAVDAEVAVENTVVDPATEKNKMRSARPLVMHYE